MEPCRPTTREKMSISRPFRRTTRQLVDGSYAINGAGAYVMHPRYASSPQNFIRAFEVLQKDFVKLLDYIEPADANLPCFSYRIHELLTRASIEIEANCRAIFADNGAQNTDDLTMKDYRKINVSHRLSSYKARLPNWQGTRSTRVPFGAWAINSPLVWYQAYNRTKHNRQHNFHVANFDALVDAMCGLAILLSAQFHLQDFSRSNLLSWSVEPKDGLYQAIGGFFLVAFANDFPPTERYDFNWTVLKDEADPFQNFNFAAVP